MKKKLHRRCLSGLKICFWQRIWNIELTLVPSLQIKSRKNSAGKYVWPRRFYFTGDMTNLYPFIQGWLEWLFRELFSANASLCNQYKYIVFNIFSCKLLQEYLMKNKLINHIWNIMLKRHNILPTRTKYFISSAARIESVQEFKVKPFE